MTTFESNITFLKQQSTRLGGEAGDFQSAKYHSRCFKEADAAEERFLQWLASMRDTVNEGLFKAVAERHRALTKHVSWFSDHLDSSSD